MSIETKNAVIENAWIGLNERGFLECEVTLNYGGSCQGFGGYALHIPVGWRHREINSAAGEYIMRVLQVSGAESIEAMKGRNVRAKASHDKVHAIGHIINDDWFVPSEMFAESTKAKGQIG